MKQITHEELARLAAQIPLTSAKAMVKRALAIWEASGEALEEREKAIGPDAEKAREILQPQLFTMPLHRWLALLMPGAKTKTERLQRFREFIEIRSTNTETVKEGTAYVTMSKAWSDGCHVPVEDCHSAWEFDNEWIGLVSFFFNPPFGGPKKAKPPNPFKKLTDPDHTLPDRLIAYLEEEGLHYSPRLESITSDFIQWNEGRQSEVRVTKAKNAAKKRHAIKKKPK